MEKVKPLQSKTMTLSQLQMKTIDVLRKVKFQLQRAAHEDGMSDNEFMAEVLNPFMETICQDREVLKVKNSLHNKEY